MESYNDWLPINEVLHSGNKDTEGPLETRETMVPGSHHAFNKKYFAEKAAEKARVEAVVGAVGTTVKVAAKVALWTAGAAVGLAAGIITGVSKNLDTKD